MFAILCYSSVFVFHSSSAFLFILSNIVCYVLFSPNNLIHPAFPLSSPGYVLCVFVERYRGKEVEFPAYTVHSAAAVDFGLLSFHTVFLLSLPCL